MADKTSHHHEPECELPKNKPPTVRLNPRPNDANAIGDIFGGWLMSQIDTAAATVAWQRAQGPVVTVSVNELKFLKPLYIYDLVSIYADVEKVGTSSVTISVEVFAQRRETAFQKVVRVAEARLTFVAVVKSGEKRLMPK